MRGIPELKIFVVLCLLTILVGCSNDTQYDVAKEQPVRKKLKIAGYNLPRLAALVDGRVKIEGYDIEFAETGIGDMNSSTFSGDQPYDITEIGLHPFMLAYANENFRDYTLLPIFPLRVFRHKSIFIREDLGISSPQDLKGKVVGTPGYSSTSLTWIRGFLSDEYGITPQDIIWVLSNKDSSKKLAGNISKQEQIQPKGVTFKAGSLGKDESDLLLSGEVAALFHAAEPKAFANREKNVGRLFPDFRKVEQEYFTKTGVFPIMHAVAIRTSLLEANPELAKAVFDAYSQAKSIAYAEMEKKGWFSDMLPWYAQELEETRGVMGKNFYSYGLEENRKTLETLFRYSHEQGFMEKPLTVEELFHPLGMKLKE